MDESVFLGAVALERAAGGVAAPALPRDGATRPVPVAAATLAVSGDESAALTVSRDLAATLAAYVASDLARLVPEVARLDLVLVGALFDPAELLRPAWPVHAALARLAARAPGERPRVLSFGTASGQAADAALQPDPALAGGPLRLLPWLLAGSAEDIAAAAAPLEELLLERGMADAATALALQSAFGSELEHVRHATIHDLCALTAMQYRHAALEGAWTLLESALLHGGDERFSDAAGPPLLLRGSTVWMGTLSADAIAAQVAAGGGATSNAHRYWQARERQLAAVFAAHGLATRRVPLPSLDAAADTLRRAAGASGDGADGA